MTIEHGVDLPTWPEKNQPEAAAEFWEAQARAAWEREDQLVCQLVSTQTELAAMKVYADKVRRWAQTTGHPTTEDAADL